MRPSLCKAWALIAGFAFVFTSARVHDRFSEPLPKLAFPLKPRQNDGSCILNSAACTACKSGSCSSGSKRIRRRDYQAFAQDNARRANASFDGSLLPPVHQHAKRVLQAVDQADVGAYIQGKEAAADALTLAPTLANGSQISYARQFLFQNFINTNPPGIIMGTGSGALTGCAMITVVSRRAVWMGHFWQSLAFDSSGNDDADGPDSANLNENVLNLIGGQQPLYYSGGDALNVNYFNQPGDLPYAFMMAPRDLTGGQNNPDNPDPSTIFFYYPQIQAISAYLQNLIPNLQAFIPVPYIADDEEPNFNAAYRRVALFEYDPNADGNGDGNWRLFYEQTSANGRQLGQNVVGINQPN